jgi:hypothetical protein
MRRGVLSRNIPDNDGWTPNSWGSLSCRSFDIPGSADDHQHAGLGDEERSADPVGQCHTAPQRRECGRDSQADREPDTGRLDLPLAYVRAEARAARL